MHQLCKVVCSSSLKLHLPSRYISVTILIARCLTEALVRKSNETVVPCTHKGCFGSWCCHRMCQGGATVHRLFYLALARHIYAASSGINNKGLILPSNSWYLINLPLLHCIEMQCPFTHSVFLFFFFSLAASEHNMYNSWNRDMREGGIKDGYGSWEKRKGCCHGSFKQPVSC